MDFVRDWLWYIVAFLVGALVAWLAARVFVKAGDEDEAFADIDASLLRRVDGN